MDQPPHLPPSQHQPFAPFTTEPGVIPPWCAQPPPQGPRVSRQGFHSVPTNPQSFMNCSVSVRPQFQANSQPFMNCPSSVRPRSALQQSTAMQTNYSFPAAALPPLPPPVPQEPHLRPNCSFTGEPQQLKHFLLNIRDHMTTYNHMFTSDKRRIHYVEAHFVSNGSKHLAAQNWFMALLQRNARDLNVTDPYADLKGLRYDLKAQIWSLTLMCRYLSICFGPIKQAKI